MAHFPNPADFQVECLQYYETNFRVFVHNFDHNMRTMCDKPCVGVFVATALVVSVLVIVFVGSVGTAVKIIGADAAAVAFPLLFDVLIAGK